MTLAQGTSISGHVYGGSDDSAPLAGVFVSAGPVGGSTDMSMPDFTVDSGPDGSYTIKHLRAGAGYTVSFSPSPRSPHVSEFYDGQENAAEARTVTPTVAAPATGIDAHLPVGGSITGTVRDATAIRSRRRTFR